MSRRVNIAVLTAALPVGVGGIETASAPPGEIHGCVNDITGVVRVPANGACISRAGILKEAVDWGTVGPQGSSGPAGTTGEPGPAGAAGSAGAAGPAGSKGDTWPQGPRGPAGVGGTLHIYRSSAGFD